MSKRKAIGIMGGTFDPIHYGHLVIAEAVRSKYNMDKVIFVPSGHPPHKNNELVSNSMDRYKMTELATKTNRYFEMSSIEIDRPGKSYTYDTIKDFQKKFPDYDLFFITGADAIKEITTWHRYQELLDICHFVAATRPGYTLDNLKNKELNMLTASQLKNIDIVEVPGIDVSSTDIKRRVNLKQPIKYLLPEIVEEYINKNELYINRKNNSKVF